MRQTLPINIKVRIRTRSERTSERTGWSPKAKIGNEKKENKFFSFFPFSLCFYECCLRAFPGRLSHILNEGFEMETRASEWRHRETGTGFGMARQGILHGLKKKFNQHLTFIRMELRWFSPEHSSVWNDSGGLTEKKRRQGNKVGKLPLITCVKMYQLLLTLEGREIVLIFLR